MTKDEAVAAIADATGSDEPVFLPKSVLQHLQAKDILPDTMVSVGQPVNGIMHVEWDGHFYTERGVLLAQCQYIWTRKYWDAPLGMPFYLDLVKRAIETRERLDQDVRFLSWDDDGAYIHLSFECLSLPDNLGRAYEEVLLRISRLEEAAESAAQNAGVITAEIAQAVSGWGKHPVEQLVQTVDSAKTTDEKGRSLEELVARLFGTVPGFTVSGRLRTETEEIDITVLNNSDDPRLKREEAVILVECKNWSSKCGKNEFVIFKEKIENRKGRCSLGFLVSWNGFAETVTKEMLRGSHERLLVVPMEGTQICDAVRQGQFLPALTAAWDRAITI